MVASVVRLQEEGEEAENRGADQSCPRRARPADEQECSHDRAAEHPLNKEILWTVGHQSDGSTSMYP